MIAETLKMITDALNNATYGVNTFITGSTPTITAYDETRNAACAMRVPPEPFPSLSVLLAESADIQGEVHTVFRDGLQIPVAITYWGRNIDTPTGVLNMWDTLRAVMQCLQTWLKNENVAGRQYNDIDIVSCNSISVIPNRVNQNDSIIPGGMVVNLFVRDNRQS
jgi:hypothetical protein